MTARRDLIRTLCERQQQAGSSDLEFARRIGVSRQMWQAIRTGEREPGRATLQKVTAAFPDLLPDVIALFLPTNATNVAREDTYAAAEVPA